MEPVNDISKRGFHIGAGLILLLALILRILGAQGDLAQDEITSLGLVAGVTRLDQIFWQINHDNSHPLNSAWLYLVGPHASFVTMRAFSIGLGVCSVAAAGYWGLRHSRVTALVTMILFATSYELVNYGSEARGYSGMVLCIMLAAMTLENILAGHDQKLRLGLIAFIGTLFHYDMAMAMGVLALACYAFAWKKSDGFIKPFDKTVAIFIVPALFMGVALAPIVITPYIVGHIEPFAFWPFLGADNLALQSALDIPLLMVRDGDLIFSALVASLWLARHRLEFRAKFFFVALVIVPVALAALHIPNTNLPRHMMLCGIAYILLAATLIDSAWHKNNLGRIAAALLLITMLVGNGMLLQKFLANGRGHYSQAVARITAQGATTYSIDQKQLTPMIDFYSQRAGSAQPHYIAMDDFCAKGQPEWMILVHVWPAPMPPDHVMQGPEGCQASYALQQDYPAWGLTGADWVLFRRD